MALESTQPLTEMSTRNLPGGKGRPAYKADNLTAICEPIVWKTWEPRRLTTLWASTACYRDSFTLYLYASFILHLPRVVMLTWVVNIFRSVKGYFCLFLIIRHNALHTHSSEFITHNCPAIRLYVTYVTDKASFSKSRKRSCHSLGG
jgi:hypothetical protein